MVFIVASLNVDSIVSYARRDLLFGFLKTHNIDLCMIQETKVDEKIKIAFDGYNIIRCDGVRGRAGTAIIVKNSFSIRNPRSFNNQIFASSMDVLLNGIWSNFASVYFPPGLHISHDFFK